MSESVTSKPALRVMLSSTVRDLAEYRAAVSEVLEGLRLHAVKMELFGAHPAAPLEVCLKMVSEADIYVGILGHRYGSLPPGCEQSFTELEYERARELGRECFIFMLRDDVAVQPVDFDTGEGAKRLRTLKDRLRLNHMVSEFGSLWELKYWMRVSLEQHFDSAVESAPNQPTGLPAAAPPAILDEDKADQLSLEDRIAEIERQAESGDLHSACAFYLTWVDRRLHHGDRPCTEQILLLRKLLQPVRGEPSKQLSPKQRCQLLHRLGVAELDAGNPQGASARFQEATHVGSEAVSADDIEASHCGLAESLISLGEFRDAFRLLHSLHPDEGRPARRNATEVYLLTTRLADLMEDLRRPVDTQQGRNPLQDVSSHGLIRRRGLSAELSLLKAAREGTELWGRAKGLTPEQVFANRRDFSRQALDGAADFLRGVRAKAMRELDRVRGERLQGSAQVLLEQGGDIVRILAGQTTLLKAERSAGELGFEEERLACRLGLARVACEEGRPEEEREILEQLRAEAEKRRLRILEADALNSLALSLWRGGATQAALACALRAYERAWCDGPPYVYSWGLSAAQLLLKELTEGSPGVVRSTHVI